MAGTGAGGDGVSAVRTSVGIVGAGPAGLLLGHLLGLQGIGSVIVEIRSRDYIERRIRAGVLEHDTMKLLEQCGVGMRMHVEGMVHHGLELRFGGRGHRIDLSRLTGGRAIMVYGQQEVVKDLVAARLDAGGDIRFEVEDVSVHGIDSSRPVIRFREQDEQREIHCDFIAGCDGFHGVCRQALPAGVATVYERSYPFAWLGILAEAPPSSDELIYAAHERGFALHSMRSPELSRLYFQVDVDEALDAWPDERIWEEFRTRFAVDRPWTLNEGPILEKLVAPLRSFVIEPMQHGRLFLAGDAAHIVPATGAKGLNLAVADVRVLADALAQWYRDGTEAGLRAYSRTCLRRIWRVQHFSWWMTATLHRFPDEDAFQRRLREAQLEYLATSEAAAASFAENYTGLESV